MRAALVYLIVFLCIPTTGRSEQSGPVINLGGPTNAAIEVGGNGPVVIVGEKVAWESEKKWSGDAVCILQPSGKLERGTKLKSLSCKDYRREIDAFAKKYEDNVSIQVGVYKYCWSMDTCGRPK